MNSNRCNICVDRIGVIKDDIFTDTGNNSTKLKSIICHNKVGTKKS